MTIKNSPVVGAQADVAEVDRTLYVVDIENMVGRSELALKEVAMMQDRIKAAVPPREGDHVVIATSHHNGAAMMFGWSGSAQRKVRSGEDGADRALLECIDDIEWIAKRFQRVVIASGDNIFTFAVLALRNAGVNTLLVPPDVGCSRAMRKAAGADVVPLGSAHSTHMISLFPAIPKDAA